MDELRSAARTVRQQKRLTNDTIMTQEQKRTNSWSCRFGFHDWSKWGNDRAGYITEYPFRIAQEHLKGPTRQVVFQNRQCQCCGKLQSHTVEL